MRNIIKTMLRGVGVIFLSAYTVLFCVAIYVTFMDLLAATGLLVLLMFVYILIQLFCLCGLLYLLGDMHKTAKED